MYVTAPPHRRGAALPEDPVVNNGTAFTAGQRRELGRGSTAVEGASEIEITTTLKRVLEVLTGLERWPSWNRDVKSMTAQTGVAPGWVFRRKAAPGTITSTIRRV